MAPNPGSSRRWPDDIYHREGSLLSVVFKGIYNWGSAGTVWIKLREEGNGKLAKESFHMDRNEIIAKKTLSFIMPGRDLVVWAECGYDRTVTDGDYEDFFLLPPGYTLTIAVTPNAGEPGDIFTFNMVLTTNSTPVPSQVVNLILEGWGKVGEAMTDSGGRCTILWTANRKGTISFHATAEGIAQSSTLTTFVAEPVGFPILPLGLEAMLGALPLLVVGGVVVAQELNKFKIM